MSSESAPTVRTTLTIVAVLWIIAILVLIYIYYAKNFTLYMDTVPPKIVSTSTPATPVAPRTFSILSSAFENGGSIPSQFTCDEKQMSPPLSIDGVPAGTQSMVLIMEDRDIPKNLKADGTFLHWVVMNIPPATREIGIAEEIGVLGASGNGVSGYMGPCAPKQYQPTEHRYYFDLYALDTTLSLPEGARVADVRAAMEGHVIEQATMMGRYERR